MKFRGFRQRSLVKKPAKDCSDKRKREPQQSSRKRFKSKGFEMGELPAEVVISQCFVPAGKLKRESEEDAYLSPRLGSQTRNLLGRTRLGSKGIKKKSRNRFTPCGTIVYQKRRSTAGIAITALSCPQKYHLSCRIWWLGDVPGRFVV